MTVDTAPRPTATHPLPRQDIDTAVPGVVAGFFHQLRYDLKMQVRNPVAVCFTVVLPLAFLLMFTGLAGGDAADNAKRYVPATMVIGLLSGTTTNLTITLAYLREYGMLRHVLVTPLPRLSYLGSRVAAAGVLAVVSTALIAVTGGALFGAWPRDAGPLLLALVAGTLVGSAMGVALTALVRSEVAATPLANAVTLPLLVLSGAFFSLDAAPSWVQQLARWLPAEPVVDVAAAAYADGPTADAIVHLLVVTTIWLVVSVAVTRAWFTWTPRSRR
ncbi:MAG: ABC transporter permease [Desertimonas sp.]